MADHPKVLIVGAGPTGLVLAHALARDGIACRLIDRAPQRSRHSKAIALHARSLEALQLLGMADDFVSAGHPIGMLSIHGRHGPIGQMDFGALPSRYPYVLSLPQSETERILEAHAARHGVAAERGTELVGLAPREGGVAARLRRDGRSEEIEADWVMGCDGARSTVREALAIPFAGSRYPERFVLADAAIEGDFAPGEAHLCLGEQGVLALFPLPGGQARLILSNTPEGCSGAPRLEQCQRLIDERGRPFGAQLSALRWSSVFHIHRREAARFRAGRVFLLGDAAHIHSPVGGQGMNMGMQDAFNLAWKLSLVIRGAASPELLDGYEAERKPLDEAVVRQTDRATRLLSLHGGAARFLRDHLMSLAAGIPSVGARLGQGLSGIAANYRHSPLVEEHAAGLPGLSAGDRLPDLPLIAKDGAALRLYDLVAGHRHVLVALGDPPEAWPAGLRRAPQGALPAYRISAPGTDGCELVDRNGDFAERFAASPIACLIRPDGYVGFRCRQSEVATRLPSYLARHFGEAGAAAARA